MSHLEKFSENALKATSSRNQIWDSVGSEDKEASEWREFRAGVDLRLGAIDTANVNIKRGEKKKNNQKSAKQYEI